MLLIINISLEKLFPGKAQLLGGKGEVNGYGGSITYNSLHPSQNANVACFLNKHTRVPRLHPSLPLPSSKHTHEFILEARGKRARRKTRACVKYDMTFSPKPFARTERVTGFFFLASLHSIRTVNVLSTRTCFFALHITRIVVGIW